jgi:pimeloyl-ACP methyl ester carboxylesterase
MAARLWRWVLGFAVLFAAGAAAALAGTGLLTPWSAAGAALAVLGALPLTFVTLSFAMGRACAPVGRAAAPTGCAALAVLGEAVDFSLAIARMSADPREWQALAALPPAGSARRPVLLIHGILCNRGVWRPLQPRLRAAGYGPVRTVNLEPLCASIELHARRLAPALLALRQECGGTSVLIVGHSMGGLVARALLRQLGPEAIGGIVTVGSPHHGTALTRGLRWPATRDMSPGSAFLEGLNSTQEGQLTVPIHSLYSLEDNLLAPARTAQLQGAQWRELRGIGHFGLLGRRRALDQVVAALELACPP